jgi:sigma-B regulation protein RsbU (phosphoserine phosphatase)
MFGKERFKDIVRENAGRRAKDIRMSILDEVAAFRGTKPQEDDITLVVLKFG